MSKLLLLLWLGVHAFQDSAPPTQDAAPSPAAIPAAADSAALPPAAETGPMIGPDEAGKHLDEKVTVKFEVLSSKLLKDSSLCFLNSKKNHRDPDDFAVVLKENALQAFRELKVDDPAAFFRGKTIAVSGTVRPFRGKPQIEVESVDQIRVVVQVPPADPSSAAPRPPSPTPPSTTVPADDGHRS